MAKFTLIDYRYDVTYGAKCTLIDYRHDVTYD